MIAMHTDIPASTVHKILVRNDLNRLAWIDRPTGQVIRRYERDQVAMLVIELRERHGLTQSLFAGRCGMDQADISRIKRGSTSPTTRVCNASPTRSTQISSSSHVRPERSRRRDF